METTAIAVIRAIPHHGFGTADDLVKYLENHYLYSRHALTVYRNFADLYFIARGVPHGTDILQYYNPCHCMTLRNVPDMGELLARAKERLENGEVPMDWQEQLSRSMRTSWSEVAAETPL